MVWLVSLHTNIIKTLTSGIDFLSLFMECSGTLLVDQHMDSMAYLKSRRNKYLKLVGKWVKDFFSENWFRTSKRVFPHEILSSNSMVNPSLRLPFLTTWVCFWKRSFPFQNISRAVDIQELFSQLGWRVYHVPISLYAVKVWDDHALHSHNKRKVTSTHNLCGKIVRKTSIL